ncbi:fumarylacetoacetate hydrolase family protein [Alicyclobacillus fastidiosus]|uniref:Fumarylacetoacetate hydrolase family protein n=1 Tax=Alicyclobacillus fastidiosus TaxID=392011 RepID=A0ABV5AJK2_9BACL|nr:fumarylacetoacetate hydrolase family protein [Alicyclobacillus fastidiosus]WEH08254.1 fumarylacetoacetate hydrolase family protein [Alicyclobacillus fastidiosus]
MKLLNVRVQDDAYELGVLTDEGVLMLTEVAKRFGASAPCTMQEVMEAGETGLASVRQLVSQALENGDVSLFENPEHIQYGPCVTSPEKIICVGTNYQAHAAESNLPTPTSPPLFSKFNNSLAGHGSTISIPPQTQQVDYEVELVIVIGQTAQNVSEEDALSYVFGYATGNDLSARDLQFRTSQWLLGKTLDGFAPIGPYLVTADEVPNPNDLNLECRVNGQLRQSSNTKDMIFHCQYLISYISRHMTLRPGDVIFTGTPEGVILGYPEGERQWLASGDEIVTSVEGLGELRVVLE